MSASAHRLVRPVAGLGLVGLLGGVPILLIERAGAPWRSIVHGFGPLLDRPDSVDVRGVLVPTLVVLLWWQWCRFVGATIVEVAARRSRVCAARGRPGLLRPLAATLLTLAGVVVPHGGERAAAEGRAARLAGGPAAPALVVHSGGLDMAWSDTGFIAGGVVMLLGTMRTHRLRTSTRGSRFPVPPESVRTIEEHLRRDANELWTIAHTRWREELDRCEVDDGIVPVALIAVAAGGLRVLHGPIGWLGGHLPSSGLVPLGTTTEGALLLPADVAAVLEVSGPIPQVEEVRRAIRLGIEVGSARSVCGETIPATPRGLWRMIGTGEQWVLQPLGLDLTPSGYPSSNTDGMRTLVDSERSSVPTPVAPDPSGPGCSIDHRAFLVRLLGPVDLVDRTGRPVAVERRKSLELLAWLTLHRRPAMRESVRSALWELDVSDASFTNVVSEARRTLQRHVGPEFGNDWLDRSTAGLLRLHDSVVSDVDVFRAHVARSERSDPTRACEELRAALAMVRGAPVVGSGYAWADAEAITSNLTLMIVDTACELGERELTAGRLDEALWSTSIGLGVLPGHEELVGLRLRILAQGGDLAGVRNEWRSYERSLDSDPWQTEPASWLESLYRNLLAEAVAR